MARRYKVAPLPSNDAFARAWSKGEGYSQAERLLQAGVLTAARVAAIADRLHPVERPALYNDLCSQASHTVVDMGHGDDEDSWTVEMFAIPLSGGSAAITAYAEDDAARATLAQTIQGEGYVTHDSRVVILRGAWTLDALAQIDPQTLRAAAHAAADMLDEGVVPTTIPELEALRRPLPDAEAMGAVLLGVLADPTEWEVDEGPVLGALITNGAYEKVYGPPELVARDPWEAWDDLWDALGVPDLAALPPVGMGYVGGALMHALLDAKVSLLDPDPTQDVGYHCYCDDSGVWVVEASVEGETIHVEKITGVAAERFQQEILDWFLQDDDIEAMEAAWEEERAAAEEEGVFDPAPADGHTGDDSRARSTRHDQALVGWGGDLAAWTPGKHNRKQ